MARSRTRSASRQTPRKKPKHLDLWIAKYEPSKTTSYAVCTTQLAAKYWAKIRWDSGRGSIIQYWCPKWAHRAGCPKVNPGSVARVRVTIRRLRETS